MAERCVWCMNSRGKTDLSFSIIDDDFGQYVHELDINYCFACGRSLKGGDKDETARGN